MPIGNDIVDLLDSESDPAGLHPRYLERVLTAEERAGMDGSRATLWSRWAAKEAAFKALASSRPELVFSPRAFATTLEDCGPGGQQKGWVEHLGQRLAVRLNLHHRGHTLHAVAATDGSRLAHVRSRTVRLTPGEDPSVVARIHAEHCLAEHIGCAEHRVQVRGHRPPRFYLDGEPSAHSLSLSHHGAWVAFAFGLG